MNCDDVRDSLEMYISGDLPDAESRDVAAHLAECASCTAEYERVRALVASVRELADAFVPVERFSPAPARRATVGWGWRLATAAALALALVALGALSVPAIARQLPLPVTSRLDRLETENAALRKQVDELQMRIEQIGGEEVPVVDTAPGDLPPEVNLAVQTLAMEFIRAQYAGDLDALARMGTERLKADLAKHPEDYVRTGGEGLTFAQMTEAAVTEDGTFLVFVRLMDAADWSGSQYQENFEIKKVGETYLVDFMGMDV
jgi:hypothetical protein